jgi:predicted membrane protein
MDKLPLSPEVLLVFFFIAVFGFLSIKSDRFKVGRLTSLGTIFILFPQARDNFTFLGFLISIVVSFIGIILIILDKKDYSTDKKDNKLSSED